MSFSGETTASVIFAIKSFPWRQPRSEHMITPSKCFFLTFHFFVPTWQDPPTPHLFSLISFSGMCVCVWRLAERQSLINLRGFDFLAFAEAVNHQVSMAAVSHSFGHPFVCFSDVSCGWFHSYVLFLKKNSKNKAKFFLLVKHPGFHS